MSMKALVIDSGALIKGGGGGEFERNADKVYTVQEVVSEIKDAVTRQRLQVLPYELEVREPSHESVKHVTSFAKQTGDYHVLSHTDIKIIALTYQLECELSDGRGSHLRTQPIKQGKQAVSLEIQQHASTGVIGMYYGPNYDTSNTGVVPPVSVSPSVSSPVSPDQPSDKESSESDRPDDDDDDDNDNDWITPDNLHRAREQMGGATIVSVKNVTVGCLTTDFSMQNVLLQMGLRVLSLDGMLIKQIHYYRMYCKACCKALIRVKAVTDDKGDTHFALLSIKQFSRRGLKFPLPKPSGGRHANNPITCPDQKLTNQRVGTKKEKVDVFSPEFVTRSSPFALHDISSRGAVGGFNKRHVDSKNPNGVKRKGKRK